MGLKKGDTVHLITTVASTGTYRIDEYVIADMNSEEVLLDGVAVILGSTRHPFPPRSERFPS
jgi:hypothetical protein